MQTNLKTVSILLLAVIAGAFLSAPAEARVKHHNSDNGDRPAQGRHNVDEGQHNIDVNGNPWDWHPGMLGDPLSSWRDEYADGITFGISPDGWWTAPNRSRQHRGRCYTYSYGTPAARQRCIWTDCDSAYYRGGWPGAYSNVQIIDGYGGYYYDQYGQPFYVDGSPVYSQPQPYRGDSYTDNSVTNNYYGDYYNGPLHPAEAPPLVAEPVGPRAPEADAPVTRSSGMRFYEKTRLDTGSQVYILNLDAGKLYAGVEGSKAALVAKGADPAYGAFAAYQPEAGLSILYVADGKIYAAYDTGKGKWWSEALPRQGDLSAGLSLGLIGNEPWAAFSDANGVRYVYTWSKHTWIEIGSASRR